MPAPIRPVALAVMLVLMGISPRGAHAQCNAGWARGFHPSGAGGIVVDTYVFDDGFGPALYATGGFSQIGNALGSSVARWDGHRWTALRLPAQGTIERFAEYNDQLLGASAMNLMRCDGNDWVTLSLLPEEVEQVRALAVYDGALYAGSTMPQYPRGRVDRWDGAQWSLLAYVSGDPAALAVYQDELYVGGITLVNGFNVRRIGRWNGSRWDGVGGGLDFHVAALQPVGDELFAGGGHATLGGARAARWNGSQWIAADDGILSSSPGTTYIRDFLMFNGELHVAGSFAPDSGITFSIGRWTGVQWVPVARSGVNIYSLSGFDGQLYAVGGADEPLYGISRVSEGEFYPLQPGLNSPVTAFAEYGGEVYAAGRFCLRGLPETDYLIRGIGGAWREAGGGPGGPVLGLTVCRDELFAIGHFRDRDNVDVARWDGAAWSPVEEAPNFLSHTPIAIGSYGDELYIGGIDLFNPVLWRWDGRSWTQCGEFAEASYTLGILDLTVFRNELYVAGAFEAVDGIAADGLARWNGSRWSAVGEGHPYVTGTEVFQDALYGFGYAEPDARLIARWDGDSWDTVGFVQGSVVAMGATPEGLLISGFFSAIGDTQADGLALWDGAQWSAVPYDFDMPPARIFPFGDDLYFGGNFMRVDDEPMPFLARRTRVLPVEGNLDRDADVDIADLSILLSNFGVNADGAIDGDLDGDGSVGIQDLVLLLGQYGTRCP